MAGPATTALVGDLVTAAFQKLNVIDESGSPSPEQGVVGLTSINDMMADYAADGIWLGWFPQTSLANTAPLEQSDVRAVKVLLAGVLASHYGIPMAPELVSEIDTTYAKLVKRYLRYTESASELPREQAVIDRTGQNL